MNSFFLAATALALALLYACDKSKPVAEVGKGGFVIEGAENARPYFHDFGNVLYGERLKHTYRLRNTEGRTLVLQDMLPSCGCTTPRASYVGTDGVRVDGSVERGKKVLEAPKDALVEIEVAIDTTLVETPNLDKLSQVRLRTDSDTNPYITLELHLKVVKAFRAVPAKLEFGLVPQSAGKSARTDVSTCVKGDGSKIVAITAVEGTFTAEVQEAVVRDETYWILVATAPPGLPIGPQRGSVTLSTTTADGTGVGAPFTVPILAQIAPDVVVSPGVLQLSNVDHEKGATLHAELLALVPGAKLKVLGTRLEGDASADLELVVTPDLPDEDGRAQRHQIEFRSKPSLRAANFRGTAIFETDDARMPRISVPYAGSSH